MICPKCGKVYNARYCPNCGTPMLPEEQKQRPTFQQFQTPPSQKSNDSRNIAIICLIFAGVTVVGILLYIAFYFFAWLLPFLMLILSY